MARFSINQSDPSNSDKKWKVESLIFPIVCTVGIIFRKWNDFTRGLFENWFTTRVACLILEPCYSRCTIEFKNIANIFLRYRVHIRIFYLKSLESCRETISPSARLKKKKERWKSPWFSRILRSWPSNNGIGSCGRSLERAFLRIVLLSIEIPPRR